MFVPKRDEVEEKKKKDKKIKEEQKARTEE